VVHTDFLIFMAKSSDFKFDSHANKSRCKAAAEGASSKTYGNIILTFSFQSLTDVFVTVVCAFYDHMQAAMQRMISRLLLHCDIVNVVRIHSGALYI
jgi:hypothetical protein